jgi:hypothetical protein
MAPSSSGVRRWNAVGLVHLHFVTGIQKEIETKKTETEVPDARYECLLFFIVINDVSNDEWIFLTLSGWQSAPLMSFKTSEIIYRDET